MLRRFFFVYKSNVWIIRTGAGSNLYQSGGTEADADAEADAEAEGVSHGASCCFACSAADLQASCEM
jgi:hypothetical protein